MESDTGTLSKTALGIGFLALAVGVGTAYADPASHYELSVYTHTPVVFWLGVGLATLVATVLSLFGNGYRIRELSLTLLGGSFAAVVGLPVVRNYHYYGTADALTHLGWTRGMIAGDVGYFSLLYPGIHTAGAFLGQMTGYPLTRSLRYVVVIFAVLFVVFVPLTAWELTGDLRTTGIAALSAATLLPITNISSQLVAYPTTQVLMFLPLVLYLLVRYLRSTERGFRPTAAGVALAVALVAVVLYHPQQALNLLGVFVGFVGLQVTVRWWRATPSSVAATRPVFAQTGILALAFFLWAPGHSRFDVSARSGVERLQRLLSGQTEIGSQTAQRGSSLTEVGSGLVEIFLKLFSVPTAYSLVTGALLLAILVGVLEDDDRSLTAFGRLMIVGFVPPTAVFVLYLSMASGFGTQSFRHYAFLMVLVTLLGAIGIARGWSALSRRITPSVTGSLVTIALVLGLVVSVATFFPSPWIYLHSQHVTGMQMDGYDMSFEHTDDEVRFYGVRAGPDRFADAHNRGLTADKDRFRSLNETAMLTDLSATYGEGWYFALTRLGREREVDAYHELRYSSESFEAARSQRGVNRVIDTGEYELFYVSG